MEKIPFNRKLYDTVQIAPAGRVDDHWSTSIISNVFEGKRAAAEKDTATIYLLNPVSIFLNFTTG